LARHIRNLLVAKISGEGTRLIAASAREKQSLAQVAGRFGELDLTRYLQIVLDVFKDLQYSLQPRLHLEIGLLKLVHAAKLSTIEEALAKLGPGSGPAAPGEKPPPVRQGPPSGARFGAAGSKDGDPLAELERVQPWQGKPQVAVPAAGAGSGGDPLAELENLQPWQAKPKVAAPAPAIAKIDEDPLAELEGMKPWQAAAKAPAGNAFVDRSPKAPPAPPTAAAKPAATAKPVDGDLRSRLYAAALELGLKFTADGIEAAEISEIPGGLEIVAPEETEFTMKESDVNRVLAAIGMTGVRAKVRFSATVQSGPPPAARQAAQDDATERALAHPAVKRFQETFPDAQVRSVRNLKE
jgi:DNA polymerase-3 subunit gamma/tau